MPKIIANLKARILEEFGMLVREVGYSAMTMQSVAKRCGVSVGTIYNYFPSKEEILIAYISYSWEPHLQEIQSLSRDARDIAPVVRCIYDQLWEFNRVHEKLFAEELSRSSIHFTMIRLLGPIRLQIIPSLEKFCRDAEDAALISEALLTWIQTGKDYERILHHIHKML